MTSPRRPGRRLRPLTRVGAWLLAVLAVVGLLVLGAGTASAASLPDAGNRVRVSTPETITAVGVSEHIAAGQGRGPPVLQDQIVVATGVAAEAAVAQASRINAENLHMTGTVANHLNDYRKDGRMSRPYMISPLTIREIMNGGAPTPDGVPGALRWDVPGTFRGSEGQGSGVKAVCRVLRACL